MEKGYLLLLLHAHLPYVRHPEYEDFLEEDWFYEALTETYIPLLKVFEGLVKDDIDFRLTISLTAPLISMLSDPLLQSRYLRYINRLIELAEKEIERTRWYPALNELSVMYYWRFVNAKIFFRDKYQCNLVRAFKHFQDIGKIDILTCGATHGYLPLLEINKNAVRGQIKTAIEHYEANLGCKPGGIWLPECGYTQGIDQTLKDYGIRYFFTDTHGILHASPRPKYGIFAPLYCKSGVAAFGRDIESSKQVWSAREGYPGDYYYRDFYRDVGFDLEYDYIRPYLHCDGIRTNIGIKYYRITGKTNHKELYEINKALDKAAEHAGNFMFNREKQIEDLYDFLGKKPIIVAPYDAELFGHWWFEGPDWINFLLRKITYDQNTLKLITAKEYLEINKINQVSTPSMSSWGWKGYNEVWLEGSNDWIYKHLHEAAERVSTLVNHQQEEKGGIINRAIRQAIRELLLAQSSDWAFIMKTGTMVTYAIKRTRDHVSRFNKLYDMVNNGNIDKEWLREIESRDNIFSQINIDAFK
ncbi:MAG: 1,4-alpha-glucan branching protein domain-containing protein [bacterium]